MSASTQKTTELSDLSNIWTAPVLTQAQEYEIYDLKPFFSSACFRDNGFVLDEGRGIIRHPLAE
jgi:hypothetical protein